MKSVRNLKRKKFRPFSNPTSKVRDVWSRFATTLSASAFVSAYVIATNEVSSFQNLTRIIGLCCFGVLSLTISIYVFKGEKDAI
jgi:hypothetical protein